MNIEVSPDGKQILSVEIAGNIWRLKKSLPATELSKLSEHISYIVENIDFAKEQDWPENELADFLSKQLTTRQKVLYRAIAKTDDWTPISKLVPLFNKDGHEVNNVTIAGLQASLTRKCRQLKKENFWESKYDEKENTTYYRIRPLYRKAVSDALRET